VILTAVLFFILTVFFFLTAIKRLSWDYNENGVHFDEESMSTYNESSIDGYMILAVLSLVPTVILVLKAIEVPHDDDKPIDINK
jgi:hypothetical protein